MKEKSSLYVATWGISHGVLRERSQMQSSVDAVLNNHMKEGDKCFWMHIT